MQELKMINGLLLMVKVLNMIKYYLLKHLQDNINELNSSTNINDNSIENAPNILELTDNEKFKDNEGNIIEIRGYHNTNFFYNYL